MKLIAHTFYATTRLRVLQIRPWPTSATIERRLVAEAAAWQEKSSGIDRGEGEGGGSSIQSAKHEREGEGRVVPVSSEDHDRSSNPRNDANNPRAKRRL